MNKICRKCDTKNRLKMCIGRDGNFKYCFRRCGSLKGLEETITPFSTIDELYKKSNWLRSYTVKEYAKFNPNDGYIDNNMCILFGLFKEKYIENKIKNGYRYPLGYIIK